MRNKVGLAMACLVFSGLLVGLAGPAWASPCPFPLSPGTDGVCLISEPINPCTGFPLKITTPGSYRLKGNLTVSCISKDAIDVTVSSGLVTIDLNGFSITGPGSGVAGAGIFASGDSSLVVHNGGIAAMGVGIAAVNDCKVEEVHLLLNGGGIGCPDGVILNNTVLFNSGEGISIVAGVVQGNAVIANGLTTSDIPNNVPGIRVDNATVTENNVVDNGGDGIEVDEDDDGSKVGENSVTGNSGDGIHVFSLAVNVIGNTADNNGGFGIRFPDATSAFTSNVVNGNGGTPDSCSATLNCNSQVCGGTSMDTGLTNLCNGVKG